MKDSNLRSRWRLIYNQLPLSTWVIWLFILFILEWVWRELNSHVTDYFTTLSCLSRLAIIVVVWTIPSSSSFSLGCFPSSLYTRPEVSPSCLARDCPHGSFPEFWKFSFIGFPIKLLFLKVRCLNRSATNPQCMSIDACCASRVWTYLQATY